MMILAFATCVALAGAALTRAVCELIGWWSYRQTVGRLDSYRRIDWTRIERHPNEFNDPTWTREEMGLDK